MSIYKVLYRLDFPTNFDIMDSPGSAMKIMSDVPTGYWVELGEAAKERQLFCKTITDDPPLGRCIIIQPQTIVGWIESSDGINFQDLYANPDYKMLLKLTQELLNHFNIYEIKRAGFRTYSLENMGRSIDMCFRSYESLMPEVSEIIRARLGSPKDYMIAFDGEHEDRIKYHYRTGPFLKGEASKYFEVPQVQNAINENSEINFLQDLDLYEDAFTMHKDSVSKWFRPLIAKATDMNNNFSDLLARHCTE